MSHMRVLMIVMLMISTNAAAMDKEQFKTRIQGFINMQGQPCPSVTAVEKAQDDDRYYVAACSNGHRHLIFYGELNLLEERNGKETLVRTGKTLGYEGRCSDDRSKCGFLNYPGNHEITHQDIALILIMIPILGLGVAYTWWGLLKPREDGDQRGR
jgi:hypothetical protein